MHKVVAVALFLVLAAIMPVGAAAQQDEESQMGAQLFDQLKAQGEIVSVSPLYDRLRPISVPIANAVQPHYSYPIHFYIVHEQQPTPSLLQAEMCT